MATATNVHATLNGDTVVVTADVDGVPVSATVNVKDLTAQLGHFPSVHEFWHNHVASELDRLFHKNSVEKLVSEAPTTLETDSGSETANTGDPQSLVDNTPRGTVVLGGANRLPTASEG